MLFFAAASAWQQPPPLPIIGSCPAPGGTTEKCAGAGGSYRNLDNSNPSSCCAACRADAATPCAGWIMQAAEGGKNLICHLKTSARYIVHTTGPKWTACSLVRNVSGGAGPPGPRPGPPPPSPPAPPAPPAPADAKNVLFPAEHPAYP